MEDQEEPRGKEVDTNSLGPRVLWAAASPPAVRPGCRVPSTLFLQGQPSSGRNGGFGSGPGLYYRDSRPPRKEALKYQRVLLSQAAVPRRADGSCDWGVTVPLLPGQGLMQVSAGPGSQSLLLHVTAGNIWISEVNICQVPKTQLMAQVLAPFNL